MLRRMTQCLRHDRLNHNPRAAPRKLLFVQLALAAELGKSQPTQSFCPRFIRRPARVIQPDFQRPQSWGDA
jgi:hypothetical protein